MRGTPAVPEAELRRQRRVVDAFLAAARGGDLAGLLAVPAPDVVRRADPAVLPPGAPAELRGPGRSRRARCCCGSGPGTRRRRWSTARSGPWWRRAGGCCAGSGSRSWASRVAAYEVIAAPERLRRLKPAVPGPAGKAAVRAPGRPGFSPR
ncbi:hypothetical protein ACFOOM_14670 [Streptomyces echinoruber]|uniref:hypothetical protein n=1 Tax=Streptomyces echinoruber TaxID=68898 RepID=UPI00361488AD